MEDIPVPDSHVVSASEGWLELGAPVEARLELDQLNPVHDQHPRVLELKWRVCSELGEWAEAKTWANQLIHALPGLPIGYIYRSYAMRRMPGGSVELAHAALLEAVSKFPQEPVIPYNLACYACRMGDMEQARRLFRVACDLGNPKTLKKMALEDEDLEPLWPEIKP